MVDINCKEKSLKRVVVSAVNLTEGGPLTILRDCLASLLRTHGEEVEVWALVNNKSLINQPEIKLVEFPKAKKSWFLRLYYEWVHFYFLSKKISPYLWLSLHDITPYVLTTKQAVYCHNPSPFYNASLKEALFSIKFFIFCKLYRFVYQIGIARNNFIVVQQSWIRDAFYDKFGDLPIIVAHPEIKVNTPSIIRESKASKTVFLYPALPRVFKNHEVVFKATDILVKRGFDDFEVRFTIKPDENLYVKNLQRKYGKNDQVKMVGRLTKVEMEDQYLDATALIFPSKLETWGLPISEAKNYGLPIIAANLQYVYETVGEYKNVCFFEVDDSIELANIMQSIISGEWKSKEFTQTMPKEPYAGNWDELWPKLLD